MIDNEVSALQKQIAELQAKAEKFKQIELQAGTAITSLKSALQSMKDAGISPASLGEWQEEILAAIGIQQSTFTPPTLSLVPDILPLTEPKLTEEERQAILDTTQKLEAEITKEITLVEVQQETTKTELTEAQQAIIEIGLAIERFDAIDEEPANTQATFINDILSEDDNFLDDYDDFESPDNDEEENEKDPNLSSDGERLVEIGDIVKTSQKPMQVGTILEVKNGTATVKLVSGENKFACSTLGIVAKPAVPIPTIIPEISQEEPKAIVPENPNEIKIGDYVQTVYNDKGKVLGIKHGGIAQVQLERGIFLFQSRNLKKTEPETVEVQAVQEVAEDLLPFDQAVALGSRVMYTGTQYKKNLDGDICLVEQIDGRRIKISRIGNRKLWSCDVSELKFASPLPIAI